MPWACLSYRNGTQDADQELPQLAAKLRSQEQPSIPMIAEGFRFAYVLILSLITTCAYYPTQSN